MYDSLNIWSRYVSMSGVPGTTHGFGDSIEGLPVIFMSGFHGCDRSQ